MHLILSEKNKRSCAMLKNTHSAGTKSYTRWSEDLRQDDPNKKQPHRAKVYLATHKKRGNDKDEHVAELENLVEEQPELAQNDQGKVAWEGDALHQVLGEEKPGQVHGMGLLPIPKQVYGHTSHHLKNINITTVDHSSDEDMDVRQELRELKEPLKKHDKVIEEQQNKETCNGKSGPTKVNYQRAYDGNVQEQAIRTNRKRIQCNAREQDESESEQRIASMNKKRHREQLNIHENTDMDHLGYEVDHNHKELPSQDNSSSLYAHDFQQEVNKQKQQKLQKTMNSREKNDGLNKTTHPVVSNRMHSSVTKVGTTVILMSAKYPNKELVAYATFLSSNPGEKVGGVEIGNQFTKVVVNHPLQENEELVRPMKHCKTIGDVHAKGMSIVWPSICIQKING